MAKGARRAPLSLIEAGREAEQLERLLLEVMNSEVGVLDAFYELLCAERMRIACLLKKLRVELDDGTALGTGLTAEELEQVFFGG